MRNQYRIQGMLHIQVLSRHPTAVINSSLVITVCHAVITQKKSNIQGHSHTLEVNISVEQHGIAQLKQCKELWNLRVTNNIMEICNTIFKYPTKGQARVAVGTIIDVHVPNWPWWLFRQLKSENRSNIISVSANFKHNSLANRQTQYQPNPYN